jgi:hypothetical protein
MGALNTALNCRYRTPFGKSPALEHKLVFLDVKEMMWFPSCWIVRVRWWAVLVLRSYMDRKQYLIVWLCMYLFHSQRTYCPLLNIMQMACKVWVGSVLTLANTVEGKRIKSCQKRASLSLHDLLATCRRSFTTSLKTNMRSALTTQNTTQNNCIISHAQTTTALQPNAHLTGIRRSLVINKGGSAFPRGKKCQGQMQTSQSVSVFAFGVCLWRYQTASTCTCFHLKIMRFKF